MVICLRRICRLWAISIMASASGACIFEYNCDNKYTKSCVGLIVYCVGLIDKKKKKMIYISSSLFFFLFLPFSI